MSKDEFQLLRCAFHDEEEIARAVCIKHKNLLCIYCVINKARSSPSCNIKPLDKITDDKFGTVVEYFRIKQSVCMKTLQLTENERTVADLRDKLKDEISEKYEQLKRHLKELKDKSLTSLRSMTGGILNILNDKKKSLNSFEADINSHLEKLLMDTDEDIAESKAQLQTIASEVKVNVNEKPYNQNYKFLSDKKLENALLEFKSGLGDIQSVDLDGYETIDNIYSENGNANIPSEPLQVKPRIPRKSRKSPGENIESSSEGSTVPSKDGKQNTPPIPPRTPKSNVPTITGISKDVNHTKEPDSDTYEDVEFPVSTCIKPTQLINKTVTVTGLNQTRPIWKFSKVVSLGESHIGLFSETKSTVIVIIGLDGSVKCQKIFPDRIAAIVATGRNQIAVVLKKKPIIKRLKLTNGCLQEERKVRFCPREQIVNITGFNYNEQQSKFAISTPSGLVILDSDGKIVKTVSIEISENSDLVTSYNFKNDCVYVLNIEHKTLKCFSYATSSEIWEKKIEESDFLARDMDFFSDKLYVSGKNYIAVFTAMDGELISTISTNDLLEDCLGVCAFEDVIVFTSGSDDSQKPPKLAFVAL